MKSIITLWLVFFCIIDLPLAIETDSENKNPNISMIVKNVSPSDVDITIKNMLDKEVTFGSYYQIQRNNNDVWDNLPYIIDNVAWNDIAYIVSSSSEENFQIDWKWLYGNLESGKYRILKNFFTEENYSDTYFISSEFIIK